MASRSRKSACASAAGTASRAAAPRVVATPRDLARLGSSGATGTRATAGAATTAGCGTGARDTMASPPAPVVTHAWSPSTRTCLGPPGIRQCPTRAGTSGRRPVEADESRIRGHQQAVAVERHVARVHPRHRCHQPRRARVGNVEQPKAAAHAPCDRQSVGDVDAGHEGVGPLRIDRTGPDQPWPITIAYGVHGKPIAVYRVNVAGRNGRLPVNVRGSRRQLNGAVPARGVRVARVEHRESVVSAQQQIGAVHRHTVQPGSWRSSVDLQRPDLVRIDQQGVALVGHVRHAVPLRQARLEHQARLQVDCSDALGAVRAVGIQGEFVLFLQHKRPIFGRGDRCVGACRLTELPDPRQVRIGLPRMDTDPAPGVAPDEQMGASCPRRS